MTTSETHLNPAALARLNELLGEQAATILPTLVAQYEVQVPQLLTQIETALTQNDVAVTRRAAHTLKTNAAYFGAEQLQAVAYAIEQAAKSNDLAGVAALLTSAKDAFAQTNQALYALKGGGS